MKGLRNIEMQITVLKGCHLKEASGVTEITKEVVMSALCKLNDACHIAFSKQPTVCVPAADAWDFWAMMPTFTPDDPEDGADGCEAAVPAPEKILLHLCSHKSIAYLATDAKRVQHKLNFLFSRNGQLVIPR